MKTVWIINHYAGDMFANKGGRHYGFAKYLTKSGYNVSVFCANTKHNSNYGKHFEIDKIWRLVFDDNINIPFVFVKAIPYHGNGIDRLKNMFSFYFNILITALLYAKSYGKPDVIVASSVHPLTLLAGIQLSKIFKVKCICEVRDLWPESIVAYGLYEKNNPIIKLLYKIEKYLYVNADALIFTMENACQYLKQQGYDKLIDSSRIFYLNNGVDLEEFNYNKNNYQIDDSDLCDANLFKVVYTGSIRKVNNIGLILDAAKCIENPNVRILIWGSGDESAFLKERVIKENIQNVVLKGMVEKKYIPYITSCADLTLMHNTPSPVLEYGLSANKLFDYAAAGKPILTDFESGMNPSEKYGAGVSLTNTTPEIIAHTIDGFSRMDQDDYLEYCKNALKLANDYSYNNLSKKLAQIVDNVVEVQL